MIAGIRQEKRWPVFHRNAGLLLVPVVAGILATVSLAATEESSVVDTTIELLLPDESAGGETLDSLIVFEPNCSEYAGGDIRLEAEIPGRVSVPLKSGCSWTLSLETSGYWVEAREVDPADGSDPIVIQPVKAGWISGSFSSPRGSSPPNTLSIQARRIDEEDPNKSVEQVCEIESDEFRCRLPAGNLDIRLHAHGFTPNYLWNVEIPWREERKLSSLPLRTGASVAGWVQHADGSEDFEKDEVVIKPHVSGFADRAGERRFQGTERRAKVNDRGFFQLVDLAPGTYDIEVTNPLLATQVIKEVRFRSAREELLEPILLSPLSALELSLSPPTDPYHQPWRLELQLQSDDPSYWEVAREGISSEEGVWEPRALQPGRYSISVKDSRGSRWATDKIEVTGFHTHHEMVLPLTRLEVTLTYEEEPVRDAWVGFANPSSGMEVDKTSDVDGRVYLFLPADEIWDVTVEQESLGLHAMFREISVPERRPKDRWPKLLLEIPETMIEGYLVDPQGNRINETAILHVDSEVTDYLGRPTKSDGSFRWIGLSPGALRLQAKLDVAGSDPLESRGIPIQLREGSTVGPLEVVLEQGQEVSGQVVSPSGHGVPGALLVAAVDHTAGAAGVFLPQTYSGADGEFELSLPQTARSAVIQVFPPGFAATQFRIVLPSKEPLIAPVSEVGGTLRLFWEDLADDGTEGELSTQLKLATSLFEGDLAGRGLLLILWSQENQIDQRAGELILPMLDPGPYTACVGPLAKHVTSVFGLPPEAAKYCVSGELAPYGELELTLPSAD